MDNILVARYLWWCLAWGWDRVRRDNLALVVNSYYKSNTFHMVDIVLFNHYLVIFEWLHLRERRWAAVAAGHLSLTTDGCGHGSPGLSAQIQNKTCLLSFSIYAPSHCFTLAFSPLVIARRITAFVEYGARLISWSNLDLHEIGTAVFTLGTSH